jgi:peptidoglycan hydrolase-like protein with peptidoglycan-binding domain
MATRTTVLVVDDLDGSEGAEPLSFALDGASYEIDLSENNAGKLRDALAGYVASARRVDGGRRGPGRPKAVKAAKAPRGSRTAPDREQTAAIREWARANGYEVSERGRLSAAVQQAFETAH